MLNYKQMLLVQLAEECNEVAQRVAKCLRFGMDDVQQGTDDKGEPWGTNEARLTKEIVDLQSLLSMCADARIIGTKVVGSFDKDMEAHMLTKAHRVYDYMNLSIKLGEMESKVPFCRAEFADDIPEYCNHIYGEGIDAVNDTYEPMAASRFRHCEKCGEVWQLRDGDEGWNLIKRGKRPGHMLSPLPPAHEQPCRVKFDTPFVEPVVCTHEDMVPLQRVGEMKPYAHYCNKCGHQECAHINTKQTIAVHPKRQRKRCIDCDKEWRRPNLGDMAAWVEL